MRVSFQSKLSSLFIFIGIGLIVAGIVTFRNSESVRDTDDLVQHTREVLYESEDALSLAQDVLLSSRGYVITGDSTFLEPFKNATKVIHEPVARLEELVKNKPDQQRRVDALKKLIEERIDLSVRTINLRNEKGFAEAQQLVASRKGKLNMDELRNTIHAIQEVENKVLNVQQEANLESTTAFNRSLYFLFSTILLLLIIVFFTIRHNSRVRKKAEEALFVKNEWYDQTLISLGDGVIATDANGVITLINKAACELSGWTQEEALGVHVDMVFDICNEKTGLRVINPLMEALRENKIVWLANHTILKRKDGSKLFIDDSGAPVHDQKNEIIGGVLIFRDVSERKKADDKLKEYQYFFDNSHDLCLIANMQGYFETVNSNLEKLLGYSEKEWTEKPFIEFVHRDDVAAVIKEFEKQKIQTARLMDFICRFMTKEGSYVWLEWSSIPNPETGKIYAIGRDISERKKAEEELLTYRNELEELVNKRTLDLRKAVEELVRNQELLDETGRLAKMGGWEVDLATMKVDWTSEVHNIHELGKAEIPSVEEAINYYAPEARPVIREAVNNAIATGEGWDLELPFITAKGKNIWIRSIGKTEMKDEKTGRVFGVFQDITEQKRAEDNIKKAIEQFGYATLASNDIIYDWDIINNTVWRNDAYYKLSGLKNENKLLEFDSWTTFIHPDDRDRISKSIMELLAGKESYWSSEYKFITKDSNIHHLADRGYVMRDKEGKSYRMIGAITDITVWKQNIQDLESIIFSLSHKVRQPVAHILGVATLLDNEMVTKDELKKLVAYMKESALSLDNFTHELTKHVADSKSKSESKNWK